VENIFLGVVLCQVIVWLAQQLLGRSFGEEGGIDSILDRSANCNTEFIDFPLRSIKANKETNSNKHNSFKKCN